MYVFNDKIIFKGGLQQKLIEDIYVNGGLKIVANTEARDKLNPNVLKVGSLVRTMDTREFWKVKNRVTSYNDDGDEITIIEWEPFRFGAPPVEVPVVVPEPFKFDHANFTLNIAGVPDSKPIAHTLSLSCYSFFLLNLRVSEPVKVEIFSRFDLLDRNPYTFIARHNHLVDNGDSFVSKVGEAGFKINTSAYSIIANEDDKLTTKFYFRVTPMSELTENGAYKSNLITVAFDYVTIET